MTPQANTSELKQHHKSNNSQGNGNTGSSTISTRKTQIVTQPYRKIRTGDLTSTSEQI